jgi:hypothetical protein
VFQSVIKISTTDPSARSGLGRKNTVRARRLRFLPVIRQIRSPRATGSEELTRCPTGAAGGGSLAASHWSAFESLPRYDRLYRRTDCVTTRTGQRYEFTGNRRYHISLVVRVGSQSRMQGALAPLRPARRPAVRHFTPYEPCATPGSGANMAVDCRSRRRAGARERRLPAESPDCGARRSRRTLR